MPPAPKFRSIDEAATLVPTGPPPPWNRDMEAAPRDGRRLIVTESLDVADGVLVRWYVALGTARPWVKPQAGWLCLPPPSRFIDFTPVGWAPYVEPDPFGHEAPET